MLPLVWWLHGAVVTLSFSQPIPDADSSTVQSKKCSPFLWPRGSPEYKSLYTLVFFLFLPSYFCYRDIIWCRQCLSSTGQMQLRTLSIFPSSSWYESIFPLCCYPFIFGPLFQRLQFGISTAATLVSILSQMWPYLEKWVVSHVISCALDRVTHHVGHNTAYSH